MQLDRKKLKKLDSIRRSLDSYFIERLVARKPKKDTRAGPVIVRGKANAEGCFAYAGDGNLCTLPILCGSRSWPNCRYVIYVRNKPWVCVTDVAGALSAARGITKFTGHKSEVKEA